MKFLFLHNNYPAQFVHILNALVNIPGNEIVFISQYKRDGLVSNKVRHIKAPIRKPCDTKSKAENVLVDMLHVGEDYANCMMRLRKDGFYPDVVYDHSGWGCGMYAADIFPDAARVCYCEWFYGKNADYNFFKPADKRSPTEFAASRQRNVYILNALRDCDLGIAPTLWQFAQLPMEYAHKIRILHDGINTEYFSPAKISPSEIDGVDLTGVTKLVTYATRGLEPYRGFPEFYKSLPYILDAHPDCHVLIMGNDKAHYSAERADGKPWGEFMRETVKLDNSRVHFLNFGSYEQYLKVLRASSVHVYLTVPFVLSWSLLEAMSCGCLVAASDTDPVREVIKPMENGLLFPFRDSKSLAETVIMALTESDVTNKLRNAARNTVVEHYALHHLLPQHINLLYEAIAHRHGAKFVREAIEREQNPSTKP